MADTRKLIKLTGPSGEEVEGNLVGIEQSVERFCEVALNDGTVLRIKPSVTQVVRLKEHWDNEGNPIYAVASQNVLVVDSVDEKLKKSGGH